MSLGGRSLATLITYVRNQREHHGTENVVPLYERCTEDDDGVVLVSDR